MELGVGTGQGADQPGAIEVNQTAAALLEALALCRQELPQDTHPIYLIRIQIIERLITHAVEREPQFWAETLARGERVADQVLAQRRNTK